MNHLPTPPPPSSATAIDLARLLSRLEERLDPPTPPTHSPPLSPPPSLSSLERVKLAANLEYARNLLLTLESQSANTRPTSSGQPTLSSISAHKQRIRRLNECLHLSSTTPSSSEDESSPSDSDVDDDELDEKERLEEKGTLDRPAADTQLSSTLRNRFATNSQQRAELFQSATPTAAAEKDAEQQLDLHRREQEDLTADMLTLASALKESSVRFGAELEQEKGLLDLAKEGLDKNALGIEGTGRKMENLRKNENIGYLWSILYPAIILGLAFLILFILFFAPKLRW